MKIFPKQPTLTRADVERLTPHLGNYRIPFPAWLATRPPTDDLKRAVMIELERAKASGDPIQSMNRGILRTLLKTIQHRELSEINNCILEYLKP